MVTLKFTLLVNHGFATDKKTGSICHREGIMWCSIWLAHDLHSWAWTLWTHISRCSQYWSIVDGWNMTDEGTKTSSAFVYWFSLLDVLTFLLTFSRICLLICPISDSVRVYESACWVVVEVWLERDKYLFLSCSRFCHPVRALLQLLCRPQWWLSLLIFFFFFFFFLRDREEILMANLL